ncbi:MAG: zinc ribbon domain-containing protein [Spirochaetia bacterium]|nr:zinc ribbon domain-containing protein [Spirochaetia bacterium]
MPTYDYKCGACGEIFEKFHGMSENPEVNCPSCESSAQKQIGAGSGVVFKGSGFYTTDYKSKQGCPAAETSKNAPSPCSKAAGGSCPAV